MNNFYKVLIFTALIFTEIFPQVKVNQIKNNPDGIILNLNFTEEQHHLLSEGDKRIIEFKNSLNESLPGSPQLPSKTIIAAIPPYSEVLLRLSEKETNIIPDVDIKINPEIELKDDVIQYQDAQPEAEYFPGDIIPLNEVDIVGYTWIRNYYCVVIKINTHRYNWKKKEITILRNAKLEIKFNNVKPFSINSESEAEIDKALSEIIINYDYAENFKSFRQFADTTGEWIDYENEYVKLAVSSDNIYKITYDDLQSYGINPSAINPLTFKIFFEGKQLPVFVSGEEDFSFDQYDYIEFYAERNYGSSDYKEIVPTGLDYKNYYDRYNDTNYVWLTWGDENGLRADKINFTPGLTDSIKTHLVKIHFEKDNRLWYYDAVTPRVQLPFWQENKVWTWEIINKGGTVSFNFNTPDFVPNTLLNTTVRLISYAADINLNAHSNGISINSTTPADTIIYNFKQTVNLHGLFNSNILNQTGNVYRIFGLPTTAGFHQSLIDWVDVEFFRYNVAVNDSLTITIPDSVTKSERILVVNNINDTSGIYIYKIKPELKLISSYNFNLSTITFTDTVEGGDRYLIIKDDKKTKPRFVVKKQFKNLRDNTRSADYILLSNKVLEESVTEYKNFIEEEYQLKTELVFIDDIYDEFSFGIERAEAVKDFLISASLNWQSPKPSYLTIIGDANYDYKKVIIPPDNNFRKNLVPSYGNPVSDTWYTTWDSLNLNIPQMFVGRIPAENNDEIYFYLDKHRTYIHRPYDDWNKNFILFSGGDISKPGELSQIRNANQNLLNTLIELPPVGGEGIHFYKTINPLSNFGPYSFNEVQEAIDNGGLFISYIGHSGTQTWDNGIVSISDLQNAYNDRNPLVTDFGCSTGKFAEPDIDAFGELFVTTEPAGEAINYLGNSSWGYLSTSLQFPQLFYSQLLIDTVSSVGEAHLKAKLNLFLQSGFSDVNRVFNFCNFLFGDPVVKFKTPDKPNLTVKENSFRLLPEYPSELTDSISLFIELTNAGRTENDSFKISLTVHRLEETIFQYENKLPLPLFKDTLLIKIPVENRVGQHIVNINLDIENSIDEIYEDDNAAQYVYYIFSTSVRPFETERFYSTKRDSLIVLNPVLISDENLKDVVVSIADNPDFNNAAEIITTMDSVSTIINLNNLQENKRYWWRTKLGGAGEWSTSYSFFNVNKNFQWYADAESSNENDFQFQNVVYDSSSNSWKPGKQENILRVLSAGFNAGSFASVLYNGQEFLPNTYFWGIATAEIDSFSLQPYNIKYFLYSEPNTTADSLIAYLESLSEGKIIAMTICDDGAQSVLGFSGGTPVRRAIEEFGSYYIDSVRYRDSWCMIGKKGAPTGTVPESFKKGADIAETGDTVLINHKQGYVVFPAAGKSSEWINIEKEEQVPSGALIEYYPLGIKTDGTTDTLDAINFQNNSASLENINSSLYSSIKILAKLYANELYEVPSITSLGINYIPLPDIAINYQVVNIDKDSVSAGENVELNFAVMNVSSTPADSFRILVEILNQNNERETVSDFIVDNINSREKKYFNTTVNTLELSGENNFIISVDFDNHIEEIFEDNNFFTIPFYVLPDTSVPQINITFDGTDILDGDFISPEPEIKIEYSIQSPKPINDISAFTIFLNEEPVDLNNASEVSYQINPENPRVVITYKPILRSGEYVLRINADSVSVEKHFIVNENAELINVFNYPNPSKGETYFTFKLTQIPDELKIKIYTIAGRQIKQITKTSSELKYDFNTIYWDGKDDDKNEVANGVYFYKIIISKDGTTRDVTEKLAIVK